MLDQIFGPQSNWDGSKRQIRTTYDENHEFVVQTVLFSVEQSFVSKINKKNNLPTTLSKYIRSLEMTCGAEVEILTGSQNLVP